MLFPAPLISYPLRARAFFFYLRLSFLSIYCKQIEHDQEIIRHTADVSFHFVYSLPSTLLSSKENKCDKREKTNNRKQNKTKKALKKNGTCYIFMILLTAPVNFGNTRRRRRRRCAPAVDIVPTNKSNV